MELFNDPKGYLSWYRKNWKIYQSEANAVKKLKLSNCLDIGAGPAIFHEVINGRKISLDISQFMLEEIENDEDKIQADALYLPIRDKGVQCTFISVTICFINDIEQLLKEVKRVTRSVFGVCIIAKDSSWGEFYEELGKRGHKYYSKAHFISKDELIKLVERYFKIIDTVSTLTFTPYEEPRLEEPKKGLEGAYVCLKAIPKD